MTGRTLSARRSAAFRCSQFGDATTLSFHATKLFSTAEGGAVVSRDEGLKRRIDLLKNLGIQDEATIALPGLNGRMNELSAALGLVGLKLVDAERQKRNAIIENLSRWAAWDRRSEVS